MNSEEPPSDDPSSLPKLNDSSPTKLFQSQELFQGERIVCIDHEGAIYRLQITSRGKLILQK